MKCPYCGYLEDRVVDSRPSKDFASVRRRRECLSCNRRFTTYEQVEDIQHMVVKKDGRRELFDRQKILRGLAKSVEKRPVSPMQIAELVDEIERILHTKEDREISTREIGELIMQRLIELDEIAYVRFASVYRQFRDIHQFYSELLKLFEKNKHLISKS
ncbi:transcriptional repressor NrdR [bacterium]|nr:transcriptional repressor NrdR [candidate division CSSED10-310 bacterium]